jgi:RNA polymerase sigma factor (sigma-70 family)
MADTDAEFAKIFNEIYPSLCRFLECLLGEVSGAAQDIAQESFIRLYRTGLESIVIEEVRFWLFRVARNLALNELTRRRMQRRLFSKVVNAFRTATPSPAERLELAEQKEMVLSLLRHLPEHQRAALLLREQEEMSYSEIARVLDVSVAKVKVDIFRARTTLRERWQRAQQSPAGG